MVWFKNWKEKREQKARIETLTSDEKQELFTEEKGAYLYVAKNLVSQRGKINAYKDFPLEVYENGGEEEDETN